MVKCPKCGAEIDHLDAYSSEENFQEVEPSPPEYAEKTPLEWGRSDAVDGSADHIDFECPDCKEVLYSNNGDSQDPAVVEFFKTGKFPEPEPPKQTAVVLFCLNTLNTDEKDKAIFDLRHAKNVRNVQVLTASKWDVIVTLEVKDADEVKQLLYGNKGEGGIRYIKGINTASQEILYVAP